MNLAPKKQTVIALGLALACCRCAFALNPALDVSQYAHTAWKIRDGFSKGVISSIAQTQDGYLWLGTEFGLLRFDGVRNVPWHPRADQPLPSTTIIKLLAASDGTLWIGTINGLASWKNGKLTEYADLAGLAIAALVEARDGSIWTGALGYPIGKCCEIHKGGIRCYPEIGGLGHGVIGLHEDRQGDLWLGMFSGVWRWKPGTPEFHPVAGEPNGIQGMADGEDGSLLFSTRGAVMRLADGGAQVAYSFPAPLREFQAPKLLRDRDGGLWVGTIGRGILHIHQGRMDVFSQSDGLSGDTISSFFEDREGNIWVATVKGLDRFRELPVVTISTNQSLSNDPGGAVLAAKDGSIWVTILNGLNRLNHSQVTVYGKSRARANAGVREIAGSGLPDQVLQSLFQDSGGRIWVSTRTKVGYLENDRFISTAAPGGVIGAITEDATGNIWMSNQEIGLVRVSPGNAIQQFPWDKFGHKDPGRPLAPDPIQGGVWLGFYKGGVAHVREGRLSASYSAADGLGQGRINDLRFDTGGALWAGTQGGLSRLKSGSVATLTSKNGLPCDAVQWTIEDDTQSLWLSMPCGLVRVARSDLDAWAAAPDKAARTIRTTVFDSSDGVRSLANALGYNPRVAKSPDGKLWFFAMDGISVVDPRRLPINKLVPPVHIEQIIADRKTYSTDGKMRLPALIRDLQIDYTALSFVAPEKVLFRYKLEGYDRDWQDAGIRRQAFYTNLPPRQYRFRVKACNNSGVWNEAGAFLDFSVDPAYYQTTWFLLSCVAAALALLAGLYRLRLHQVKQQFHIGLEARVAERTRIARDLHDTLLQSFQGVLMKFHVLTYLLPSGEARERLEDVIEQARQAIAEGRDAVQGLRSSTLTANNLAEAIGALGQELAGSRTGESGPEFSVQVEGSTRDLPPLVRDEVNRIASEAVRNAFLHAQARHIQVEIGYEPRQFRLLIRDDGKGIDQKVLDAGGREGHHGLPGMRERAQIAGGKLDVSSRPASGTEIVLTIPASLAYAKSPAARQSDASDASGQGA